jgi:hypothetical protein
MLYYSSLIRRDMSFKVKPSFIIRELKLDECEGVRNIWTEVEYIIAKYNNEVMMKIDPKAILVTQDIETGNTIMHDFRNNKF